MLDTNYAIQQSIFDHFDLTRQSHHYPAYGPTYGQPPNPPSDRKTRQVKLEKEMRRAAEPHLSLLWCWSGAAATSW